MSEQAIIASNGADTLDQMIAWEAGQLDPQSTLVLFQKLIDDGSVWKLQGAYGRMAQALIDAGYCSYRMQ